MPFSDSVVFDEYRRQLAARGSRVVDLSAIWHAAGRPRGKSPRQWDALNVRCNGISEIVDDRGDAILATRASGLDYAMHLDHRLEMVVNQVLFERFVADPARHVIARPDPIVAALAVDALTVERRISSEEAKRSIIAETVARTAPLGSYAQETKVADVQRALHAEPTPSPERKGRNPRRS